MLPTIFTYCGVYFDFEHPTPEMVRIEDIAHALSLSCRFGGHTREFYSVAQHSVLVSRVVPPEYALEGLLHDAVEAYVGDMPKPLKNLLPDYQAMEQRIEDVVFERFGLALPMHPEIKEADIRALVTEQRDVLRPHDTSKWATRGFHPFSENIVPLPPKDAEALFLERYRALSAKMSAA